jgi:hypothetical protein
MKANQGKVAALLGGVLLIAAALAVTACDTGTGRGVGETITYRGDAYVLTITENTAQYAALYTAQEGDRYELAWNLKRSAGTVDEVTGNGTVLSLLPDGAAAPFRATVSGTRLTALNGQIRWTDGSLGTAPGALITPSDPSPPYTPSPIVWTVVYHANGGSGDMDDSTAPAGEGITLSANGFTRPGCTFAGWAESVAGKKAYEDGAIVSGISDTNQIAETTLNLYALWAVESGQEARAVAAATSGSTITLPNVVWNDDLKAAVGRALSGGGITLDLSAVTGLTEWDNTTLGSGKGNITSLTLPDTVTTLMDGTVGTDNAFYGYNSLTSVSGKGVTDVNANAFYDLTALETVSLPAAMDIGAAAFAGTGLTKVEFPAATDIGYYAFAGTSLTEVILPTAMDIGDYAFNGCPTLKTVSLPMAMDIGVATFAGTGLTEVILPSATDIGDSAFYGCTKLTKVELPVATTIGDNAFDGCTDLTTVSLPAAMEIGGSAFGECDDLASLTLPAAPPTLGSSVFTYTDPGTLLSIHVGSGNISAYTAKWGVDATTTVGGNTGKYGDDHKAIEIVN